MSSLTSDIDCLPKKHLVQPHNNWKAPRLPARPVVALCESEAHVRTLRHSGTAFDVLIALTPEAAAACYLSEQPYLTLEAFFDPTAFRDGDEPMLALQSLWSDQIDDFFWRVNPEFRELGFRPAGHYFFFLKVMIDALFGATFALAHLFISAQPKEVVYFGARRTRPIDETLFFDRTAFGAVLSACATEYGVPVRDEGTISQKFRGMQQSDLSFRQRVRDVLPAALVSKYREIKTARRLAATSEPSVQTGPKIIFAGGSETELVVKSAARYGFSSQWLSQLIRPLKTSEGSDARLNESLDKWWDEINRETFFAAPFVWCGVDLRQSAEERLRFWWYRVVPGMWRMLRDARACFSNEKPDAVFVAALWRPEEHAALQAARSLNIPSVTYQHGGFEGSCEYLLHDLTESRMSDYRLAYGSGDVQYSEERARHWSEPRARALAVGSVRLDALRATKGNAALVRQRLGLNERDRVVLYVATSYQRNWYMSRQAYYGTSYFNLLTQVVDVFGEFPDLKFIYKPFPDAMRDPLCRIASQRLPNCTIAEDVPLYELTEASDACIFDFPSTALLEGLLTQKPMLVFSDDRYLTLRPLARDLLRKRVTLCEKADEFLAQLRLFLTKGEFAEVQNASNDFLRTFGMFQDDGRSLDRVFEALGRIVKREV